METVQKVLGHTKRILTHVSNIVHIENAQPIIDLKYYVKNNYSLFFSILHPTRRKASTKEAEKEKKTTPTTESPLTTCPEVVPYRHSPT